MNYSDDEIEAALRKFCSLPRGTPEWLEAFELLDGLGLIKMEINRDWFDARIAEMEARGERFYRTVFPGSKLRALSLTQLVATKRLIIIEPPLI